MFVALTRARPLRRDAVALRAVHGSTSEPPRVAYAVGKHVGGSVERNRVRRRLREAVRECASELTPGSAYLVTGSRAVMTRPFTELSAALRELARDAGRR